MKCKPNLIKIILLCCLSSQSLAISESKQIDITAIVPKFCKFTVENTSNAAGLNLATPGKQKVHIANLHLDCNSPTGYSIILHSANEFKLHHTKQTGTIEALPYELEIKGAPAITKISATEKKVTLVPTNLASVFEVYINYHVAALTPGNYDDHLTISLQIE
jgi:hypothetical protein